MPKYAARGDTKFSNHHGAGDANTLELRSVGGAYFAYVKSDAQLEQEKKEADKKKKETPNAGKTVLPEYKPPEPPPPQPDVTLLEKLENRTSKNFSHEASQFSAYYEFFHEHNTKDEDTLADEVAKQLHAAKHIMDNQEAARFIHTPVVKDLSEEKPEESISVRKPAGPAPATSKLPFGGGRRMSQADQMEEALKAMQMRCHDDVCAVHNAALPAPTVGLSIPLAEDALPEPERMASRNIWQTKLAQAVRETGEAARSKKELEMAKWKEIVRLAKEPGVVTPMSKRSGRGKSAY